jgi:methyltransferase-like protein/cyclopropane fatty-acyl-phospholipid synthase-like methyltransferase
MTSYDTVPYPSLPIRRSHPSHLAAMGRLFALDTALPSRCRVLELGCAAGGNLLPMAADYDGASFLGIDASVRQIADGQAAIAATGLTNLEIRAENLADFPADAGLFDYIICHGVYSWVPRPIQEQIMAIGRRHLHPNGVFFLSYNTYPGWHLRGAVRDMMRFHTRRIENSAEKIAQSRALLDFLVKSASGSGEAYQKLLRDEAGVLAAQPDSYLFHEHLEDDNEPLYFYQFMERTEAAGLQYLSDADFSTMVPANFGAEVAGMLGNVSRLAQEQYLDFLRNRTFRASLLCQSERRLALSIDPLRLANCDIALEDRLDLPAVQLESSEPLVCRTPHDTLTATRPETKAALAVLNRAWPSPLSFEELIQATVEMRQQTGKPVTSPQQHRECLAQDAFTLLTRRLVQIGLDAPRSATTDASCPRATAVARWQATLTSGVTNRRHEHLKLSDLNRCVLARLDGRHNRAALGEVLKQAVGRSEFEVRREGALLRELDDATGQRIVDHTLADLAQKSLLAG